MDSPSPTPEPTISPEPAPPPAVAAAAPGLARRLAPLALATVLGGGDAWLFQRDVERRGEVESLRATVESGERAAKESAAQTKVERDARARVEHDRERLEGELAEAKTAAQGDGARLESEKAALSKKVAELADKLGESEAARAAAEAHGRELDQVMAGLKQRRINARRLAGLEAPPRVSAEVVSVDEGRTPPLLVLRVRDSLAGLEEGDVFHLVRNGDDGSPRETGQVVLERVDANRRLLQARIRSLDAGEKIAIGDKVVSVAPAGK